MKPVLIQTLIRKNKKQAKPKSALDDVVIDNNTPLAKFIFWALAAIIVLSILLA